MSLERDLTAGIDPLAWLALADLCEESGDPAAAELWRRRAGCLRVVLQLRALAESEPAPRVYHSFDLIPGWVVGAYLTEREVRATLMRVPSALTMIGRYHLPLASLLGHTQRSRQMAERYLRRKAFEWAEMLTPGGKGEHLAEEG